MGIGLHTGQVVVGNIGSPERMKYGVVGSHVNLTSRIQSYTTGGQILISDATRQEAGQILKLGKQTEVKAKGVEHPITLFELLGIGGKHKLLLPDTEETLVPLADEIPLRYEVLDANQASGKIAKGGLTKVSRKGAEARLEAPVPNLSNLKMRLIGSGGKEIPGTLYGKVTGAVPGAAAALPFASRPSRPRSRRCCAGSPPASPHPTRRQRPAARPVRRSRPSRALERKLNKHDANLRFRRWRDRRIDRRQGSRLPART